MPALSQAELRSLLPHAGNMCLLHAIEAWDAQGMSCSAISHHDPSNPLRQAQQLPAICGLEYAAQAMALHCALTSGKAKPAAGYLGGVRDLRLLVQRLDAVRDPLSHRGFPNHRRYLRLFVPVPDHGAVARFFWTDAPRCS